MLGAHNLAILIPVHFRQQSWVWSLFFLLVDFQTAKLFLKNTKVKQCNTRRESLSIVSSHILEHFYIVMEYFLDQDFLLQFPPQGFFGFRSERHIFFGGGGLIDPQSCDLIVFLSAWLASARIFFYRGGSKIFWMNVPSTPKPSIPGCGLFFSFSNLRRELSFFKWDSAFLT